METIRNAVTGGYDSHVRICGDYKQTTLLKYDLGNGWFEEECQRITDEKNVNAEYVIAQAQESMKQKDMRRFYEAVKDVRRKTAPSSVMFNDRGGILPTDTTKVAIY